MSLYSHFDRKYFDDNMNLRLEDKLSVNLHNYKGALDRIIEKVC